MPSKEALQIAFVVITAAEYNALRDIARVAANYNEQRLIPQRKQLLKMAAEYNKGKWAKVVLSPEFADYVVNDFTE